MTWPIAPLKFHPVGVRVSADVKCSPKLGQPMLEFSGVLKCSPKLGQLMLEFSGV
jgi:hypothetical protein